MSRYEEEVAFECPFCAYSNMVNIDFTAGQNQSFVVDCENCCHPILITVDLNDDGIENFSVEKE